MDPLTLEQLTEKKNRQGFLAGRDALLYLSLKKSDEARSTAGRRRGRPVKYRTVRAQKQARAARQQRYRAKKSLDCPNVDDKYLAA